MISQLATANGNAFSYQTITSGGFMWVDHRYSAATMNTIDVEQYDYLILQEQSLKMATNEYGFAKHQHQSFRNADIINHQSKISNACRKTMLYLTWGRKEGNAVYEPGGNFGLRYQDMQDYLTENYLQLAHLIDAEVSPVGEAWRKTLADYPQIELYANDGSHPSVAGSYLAACVFYAALFQEYISADWHPASISATVAQQLQSVANEVVINDLASWNINQNTRPCNPAGLPNNTNQWSSTYLNNFYLSEVHFTDNQHGFVKGTGPGVWQTTDAGDHWNPISLPEESKVDPFTETSFDITFLNKDTLWYVINADDIDSSTVVIQPFEGSTGDYTSYLKLFLSTDGGISWEERSPNRNDYEINGSGYLESRPRFWNMSLVFEPDGLHGALLCNYEYNTLQNVIHSFVTTDGGLTWGVSQDTIVTGHTGVFWQKNASEAYVSGYKAANQTNSDPQRIYQTLNSGQSWQEVAALSNNCCQMPSGSIWHNFSAFKAIGDDTLLAVNSLSNPTLYRSGDGSGTSWDEVVSINAVGKATDILQPRNQVYYLLINNDPVNRILVSYDDGQSWKLEAYFDEPLNSVTATDDYVYAVGGGGSIHRKPLALVTTVKEPFVAQDEIILFPNPSKETVRLKNVPANATITLYQVNGIRIVEYVNSTGNVIQLQTQNLSPGIYLVSVASENGVVIKKLIIE